ncbi:uncharacterized protein LOC141617770 [Silene latifolia]|uniref:uncharacterized protein LOC141617770 n=1 Tax=Silene latifolia TaxID=37657 RepID=UPI003D789F7C
MVKEVTFLGYIVSGRCISVDQEKITTGEFHWTENAQQSFEKIKKLMCETPILKLPDFDQLFEVESVMHCSHYLKPKPFMLYSDHETLRFINSQHKLSHRHAKWVEFLQSFTFSSKYKEGKLNVVADALSRRHSLLTVIGQIVLGFEFMKELYKDDPYLSESWITQTEGDQAQGSKYLLHEDFLSHSNKVVCTQGLLHGSANLKGTLRWHGRTFWSPNDTGDTAGPVLLS